MIRASRYAVDVATVDHLSSIQGLEKSLKDSDSRIASISSLDLDSWKQFLQLTKEHLGTFVAKNLSSIIDEKYGDGIRASIHIAEVQTIFKSIHDRLLIEKTSNHGELFRI